ncbi:hypothetical protein B0T09DRAFT_339512 [Sordaria sp. MPI-SDFR-AT-0083]|nr:hypothetical protein B0T09DRAFT_339512 [Sordaria sp. MPI-SDFR-AT-0083]
METSKAKLEADHPDTLTSMADLAFRWNSQGRHEDALALMQDHIEAEARERHPGDFDSDESVSSSDNDSVFSILSSLPSTSSQGSVTDIKVLLAQNLATLLSEDEALISLISAAKFQKRIGFERMRENFRKLLKYFALDLKAEISSDQHRAVVGFVSSYSANITRELFSTPSIIMDEVQILFPRSITKAYNTEDSRKKVEEYLSKEFAPDKPAKLVEPVESAKPNNQHHLNNLNEFTEPNEDSDQDSVDDGAGEEEPYDGSLEHLDQMKCFILESLAYQALRRRLHEFVYPSLRSRLRYLIAVWSKDDHKYHTYVNRYELSNLVAELQYIDPHEIRFYDGEEERGYVSKAINYFQNAVEHWTGEHWDWWPLAPYLRPLEGGETRISWECTCGEKRWAEVPLSFTKRLKSIIRKLPRSSIPLLPLQNPQSRPTPHPPTSSDQGAQRNNQTSGQSPGNNHRDQPPASQPQIAGGNGATVIGIGQPDRRVLFIVSQGIDYKLAQICITGLNDCQAFFGTLKENYFRLRGQLRSWFSIWRYSHCDFYKCEKFDDHEFAPKQKDSFPDAVNPDYEYQPKPIDSIPPVSKHEFQKRFYACHDTQGIHHRYHKCRILGHQSHGLLGYLPKKITELEEGGDKREVFWGIYAREIISLRWVLCYNFVCMFPMLVFFVCWVSPLGQNTDLQNPSVPISIMLSMLSLFWSIFLSSLQFGRSK